MKRKEFHEMVDFSLVLNEWATTQPGYKSPVSAADVEEVMAKVRPLLKRLKQKPEAIPANPQNADMLKLKILMSHIGQEKPKKVDELALLKMSEEWRRIGQRETIEYWNKMEKELIAKHLLALVKSEGQAAAKLVVTESGWRFVREFQQKQKTGE
jgi:hypothetical protein